MSLYTPVFPSFHESNGSRKGPPEKTVAAAPGKQHNYVEFLRDVHLFLSTQSDVLSPPSRPNSPSSDRRVQKVRDEIQNVFNVTGGETSSGKWARISQTLKLGCVRGRHWSVSGTDPCAPEEDTKWILPDEESEWIEWEKKREENGRLKQNTNASQQIGSAASLAADSQKPNHASSAELIRPYRVARGRLPPDVSPSTLRAAKEKVIKWQASVASSEVCNGTISGSSPASTRAIVTANAAKGRIKGSQQSRTIDFTVVKPAAKSIINKRGKGSLSRLDLQSGSAPSRQSKSSTLSKPANAPEIITPVDGDETGSEQPPKYLSVKDDTPKIADIPETPYLPPSFPTHLETSTPLPNAVVVVRAKPSPILPLPALSSALSLPTSADPPDGRHVVNAPPSLPSQIDTLLPGKRSRAPSASLDGIPNNPPLTPPPKKLRTLSQNRSTPSSKYSWPTSSNGGLDIVPCTRDNALDPSPSVAPGAPSTPRKDNQPVMSVDAQGFPEKIPSPTKSIKSYFSAPDSDPADSPVKANLLLESPVSPMLSYAQNPSGFLPQVTSTQVEKGSSTAGQTTNGTFGMGFSSQFDVERHVDRVSELLEKDVDFDGWLRDVRTVETSQN